jgi:hypothetical protein
MPKKKQKPGVPQPPRDLVDMLSYMRPHGSVSEIEFLKRFIDTLPGVTRDAFGNRLVRVGPEPQRILWSCHVDTVHNKDGRLEHGELVLGLRTGLLHISTEARPSVNCLGADDTAGVWIMRKMIANRVPGLYVFHRGEEQGCLGSKWIKQNTPDLLTGIDFAIAFDRQGTNEVITHQVCGRTASDTFAKQFAAICGPDFKPSDRGVFTDTYTYARLIPECTNISVGYYGQHSVTERLDWAHLNRLLSRLLQAHTKGDLAALTAHRDPTAFGFSSRSYSSGYPYSNYGYARYSDGEHHRFKTTTSDHEPWASGDPEDWADHDDRDWEGALNPASLTAKELVTSYPEVVLDLLEQMGIDELALREHLRTTLNL